MPLKIYEVGNRLFPGDKAKTDLDLHSSSWLLWNSLSRVLVALTALQRKVLHRGSEVRRFRRVRGSSGYKRPANQRRQYTDITNTVEFKSRFPPSIHYTKVNVIIIHSNRIKITGKPSYPSRSLLSIHPWLHCFEFVVNCSLQNSVEMSRNIHEILLKARLTSLDRSDVTFADL